MPESKEYDPFEHRPAGQKTMSSTGAFIHLMKMAIGSGILFLPNAFKKAGYISAFATSVFVGILGTYEAVILIKCGQKLCKMTQTPTLTYAETVKTACTVGPKPLRKHAKSIGILINVFVIVVQYMTSVVYAIYIATSAKQLLRFYSEIPENAPGYEEWKILLCLLPIFILSSLAPDLKFLVPFSAVGSFFLVSGVIVTAYYFVLQGFDNVDQLVKFTNVVEIPVYGAMFLFAMHNSTSLFPIENTMKDPKKFPKIIGICMSLTALFYIAFGFFGYNMAGIETCDTIIKSLPMNQLPSQLVKIAIALSVLLSYGPHYFIPISVLWPMISDKVNNSKVAEISLRVGGVLLSTLQAIALPDLDPVLNLVSGVCMSTLMILIPLFVEIATNWSGSSRSRVRFILVKNFFIFIIYLIIMATATRTSIVGIIDKIKGVESPECKPVEFN